MKSTSAEIGDAVNQWENGEFESWDECYRKTGVIRQTIVKRLQGSQSHHKAHALQQKMPPEMEEVFLQWILAEDRAGQAPNYARMWAMAEEMLQGAGLPTGLGENWHHRFKERHPEIKAVHARHVDADCVNACNLEAILEWFK